MSQEFVSFRIRSAKLLALTFPPHTNEAVHGGLILRELCETAC